MSVSATPDPVPMVTSPLDTLIVSSGVYFEFIIPENTFIDLQDGNTRNLTLSFLDINGQVCAAHYLRKSFCYSAALYQ